MGILRLLAVLATPQVVGLLSLLMYACAISSAFSKTLNIVQTLNSEGDKIFKDFNLYLLPFFIPQFATIVLHPVAVVFTLADGYLSQTQRSGSVLTVLTTTATTTSNILFLLSAGTSIFITSIVTAYLQIAEFCNENPAEDCFVINFTQKFNDPELKKASITAMAGLLLTTLVYAYLPCFWSHILRQRRERPEYARIHLAHENLRPK